MNPSTATQISNTRIAPRATCNTGWAVRACARMPPGARAASASTTAAKTQNRTATTIQTL